MFRRRSIAATVASVAAASALALVLAGCSSSSSAGNSSSSTTSSPVSSSSPVVSSPASSPVGSSPVGSSPVGSSPVVSSPSGPARKVKLQLQWFTQAQFAGYIAARDMGFYSLAGLDVSIVEGGSDIVPQTVLSQGQADFAIAWVPKALQSREQGAKITDIGQVFQRSGTLQISMKSADITKPADLKGKKVGDWGFGNEYELFAGMTKAGLDPATDITLVQQQFDMQGFLSGDIDAAQAMVYNEYAQVLEATNPKTGKLYTPDDLNVLSWNQVGTGMLQDAIWANTDKLTSDPTYQDTAVKFLAASYAGWIFCATEPTQCRDLVVKAGSKLGASHQLWQMNEVNKLIWPSPAGIGMVDKTAWDQTVSIAKTTKNADGKTVLSKDPEGLAYTNDYTTKAQALLKTLFGKDDLTGSNFKPLTVTLNPGGS